ncbi:MAG: Lrp/AsnC family transcriptional regulator [Flavobacteriaceae bacterium]|nr:Lrp/AsnC family transcriptional regulator [Flavobacteriaceae bacterium]
MAALDTIDKKLLNLLQADAKATVKQLAIQLDLSATAVHERIKKLERQGFILKYVGLVNRSAIEKNYMVFCHVKLVQHTQEFLLRFEREVIALPEVLECHHVSGDSDYILKICVKDMQAYREFMVNKLTGLHHIGSTHSSFVISEVKNTTKITL